MPERVMGAQFFGAALGSSLSALWVQRAFGVHETAVMHFIRRARPAGAPIERAPGVGTPVQLAFGRAPGAIALWQGYVHHHADLPGPARARPLLEVVAMGTSYVLSTERARSYANTSVSNLATTMAAGAGLRALVATTSRKRAMIVQDGRSDFALLAATAREEGLRLWVGGGLLQLVEPATLFHRSGAVDPPVFGANASGRNAVVDFRVVDAPTLAGEDGDPRARSAYGFTGLASRATQRVGTGAGGPLSVVDTSQDLANLAQVVTARFSPTSVYTVEVSARLSDGQHLRPGSVLDIADPQVPPQHRGRWLVSAAEHEVDATSGVYTTVRLVRTPDGRGRAVAISAASTAGAAYLAGPTWRARAQGVERV